ncbi:MAG: phosphoribosyltransferase family protein [Longimicrobiales bacterium]
MPHRDASSNQNRGQPLEYLDLTWEMFGELCRALALKVARDFDPDLVIGIARAGVIPGAVVASILRKDFYALTITRREGGELVRDRPAVLSAAPMQCRGKKILLVDEITSSGETLRLGLASIRDQGPEEVRTATSFSRRRGFQPDYAALETDSTIIFPWDRKIYEGEHLVVNPRYEEVIEE